MTVNELQLSGKEMTMSVKIYTRKHEETAEYVRCCMCGKEMLVSKGTESCPACKNYGTLSLASEEKEVNVAEFKERQRKLREIA